MKRSLPLPRFILALAIALMAAVAPSPARADRERYETNGLPQTPKLLDKLDVEEHLGQALPLDTELRDESGGAVRLGSFFDGRRPVLLVFAYHTCPMLCSRLLDGVVKAIKEVSWTVGEEYDLVSISIDPRDTPEVATKKRDELVAQYGRSSGAKGWHFLVGDEASIKRAADAAGFAYRYDPEEKQYAHPAAMFLVTPDGKMARYLYGVAFEPKDVRFGLLEASEGRSVSIGEKILLYCYQYDPKGKKYSLVAMNVMRVGGAVTVVVLGTLLAILWARERRKRKRRGPRGPGGGATRPEPSDTPRTIDNQGGKTADAPT